MGRRNEPRDRLLSVLQKHLQDVTPIVQMLAIWAKTQAPILGAIGQTLERSCQELGDALKEFTRPALLAKPERKPRKQPPVEPTSQEERAG